MMPLLQFLAKVVKSEQNIKFTLIFYRERHIPSRFIVKVVKSEQNIKFTLIFYRERHIPSRFIVESLICVWRGDVLFVDEKMVLAHLLQNDRLLLAFCVLQHIGVKFFQTVDFALFLLIV